MIQHDENRTLLLMAELERALIMATESYCHVMTQYDGSILKPKGIADGFRQMAREEIEIAQQLRGEGDDILEL